MFLLCALVSLTYVFVRAPVYRSSATLVISAPSSARPAGEAADPGGMVNHSPAALQRQVLLSRPALAEVFDRTEQQLGFGEAMPGSVSELRDLLEVTAAENSKILELSVEGQQRREAIQAAVAEAEQAVVKAARAVADIRRQLDDHKQLAAEFTTRFAEHEALTEELARLESLYRGVKDRLVQVEVVDAHQPAEITVLERAYLSGAPVRPHYMAMQESPSRRRFSSAFWRWGCTGSCFRP